MLKKRTQKKPPSVRELLALYEAQNKVILELRKRNDKLHDENHELIINLDKQIDRNDRAQLERLLLKHELIAANEWKNIANELAAQYMAKDNRRAKIDPAFALMREIIRNNRMAPLKREMLDELIKGSGRKDVTIFKLVPIAEEFGVRLDFQLEERPRDEEKSDAEDEG